MEKLTFTIQRLSNDMCRIVANDIRTDIKKIADGGCILSIEVLLDEMEHIKKDAKSIGFEAVFKIENLQ